MHTRLDIPDEIARRFAADPEGLSKAAREALAILGVRARKLNRKQVAGLLPFKNDFELDTLLIEHGVYKYFTREMDRQLSLGGHRDFKLNGREVRKRRLARRWTAETLAEEAGVATQVISRIEDPPEEDWGVRARTAYLVAEALRCPLCEILAEFEVDCYTVELQVEPLSEPQEFDVEIGYGSPKSKKHVSTDNIGHVRKIVTFSERDGSTKPFTLQYRTRSGGVVHVNNDDEVSDPCRNAFLAEEEFNVDTYHDNGTDVFYKVRPSPHRTYVLDLTVYKGYDVGQTDITCHIPDETHYENIMLTLDLTKYVEQGYRLNGPPRLVFFGCDEGPERQNLPENYVSDKEPLLPFRADCYGRWDWKLKDPRAGVMYLSWGFEQSRKANTMSPDS
jgi:transcriptional regulator with XRE-family HTH domain